MHSVCRVVFPLILSVDGAPVSEEEVARIDALRPELQRWFLTYGYACLFADVIVVPERGDWDQAAFHQPGNAYGAALDVVRNRYPALLGGEHIPLVFLKGVNRTELGSLGWGGLGFATVSWDTVLETRDWPQEKGHWLAGVAAHEIGHALGWGHITDPYPHLMYHWWMWAGLHFPPPQAGAPRRVLSMVEAGNDNAVCPMPPE